jgi:hypothetical protein
MRTVATARLSPSMARSEAIGITRTAAGKPTNKTRSPTGIVQHPPHSGQRYNQRQETRSLNGRIFDLQCGQVFMVWSNLMTRAQQPGARDAPMATATLPPGSLQGLDRG